MKASVPWLRRGWRSFRTDKRPALQFAKPAGNGSNCNTPRCCAKTYYAYLFFTTCVKAEAAADLAALEELGLLRTLPALLAALGPVVSLLGFFDFML